MTRAFRIAALPRLDGVVQPGTQPGTPAQGGALYWLRQDAAPQGRFVATSLDVSPVTQSLVEAPPSFAIDPASGAWTGIPRWGDIGRAPVVARATTPTGGSLLVQIEVAVDRPTRAADAWLPWTTGARRLAALPEAGARFAIPAAAAVHPVSADSVVAGGRVDVALPGAVLTLRVFAAGADGVTGTADDVELVVEVWWRDADGRIVVKLAGIAADGSFVRVVVQRSGG